MMTKEFDPVRSTSRHQPLDSVHDDILITRIAQHRDERAFRDIFRRYEKHAYNLARNLTRDKTAAEDVVQEAMLRLWISAKTYRPGKVQSWLLCIVAREALKTRKRKVDLEKKTGSLEVRKTYEKTETGPGATIEGHENVLLVRDCLSELPQRSRDLVTLYFGAGLSQEAIGKELSIPTRTVSHQIAEVLKLLKNRLVQRGLAASLPLALEKTIQEICLNGLDVPVGLAGNVLKHIGGADSEAFQMLDGAKAGRSGSPTVVWAVIGAIALLGLSIAAWQHSESIQEKEASVKVTPAIEKEGVAKPKHFEVKWSFENGAPAEMKIIKDRSKYKIGPTLENQPALLFSTNKLMSLYLPKRAIPLPFILTLKVRLHSVGKWGANVLYLSNGRFIQIRKSWNHFLDSIQKRGGIKKADTIRMYFTGTYLVKTFNGTVFSVFKIDPIPLNARLAVATKNWGLESLEIRSVELDEIPEMYREPERFIKTMKLKESIPQNAFDPGNSDIKWVK